MDSLVQLYLDKKKGNVMALKAAKTEAGFWIGQPPVTLLSASDRDAFSEFLKRTLESMTVTVPTPNRDSFPTPSSLGFAYKKGWRAFHNEHETLSISLSPNGTYELAAYLANGEGDAKRSKKYSGANAFDEVVSDVLLRITQT
jgi:hypothetical protein